MFSLFKPKPFFNKQAQHDIREAIVLAEQRTSGEIRLFVESRCRYVDPIERAREVFYSLKMDKTAQQNGVLVYMAFKDRQLSIFGDEGIYQKTGIRFWEEEVQKLLAWFNKDDYTAGFITIIKEIGEALNLHFPYNEKTDKNELPDEIVFGK